MDDTEKNQISKENQVEGRDPKNLASGLPDFIGKPEEFSKKCKTLTLAIINDLNACDAKWQLFVTAVQNENNYHTMLPYLPGFVKNYTHLMHVVSETPNLHEIYRRLMSKMKCCGKMCILLVHWVLFELPAPNFESFSHADIDELIATLPQNHSLDKPTYVFKVGYDENSKEEELFKLRSSFYSTKFSFFGCDTDNLLQILCDGFKKYKGYANGNNEIPLNTECAVVLGNLLKTPCWQNSVLGDFFKAVLLCEFITRADYIDSKCDYELKCSNVLIRVPDMIRIRYILFYCEKVEKVEKNGSIMNRLIQKLWKSEYMLPICGYAIIASVLGYAYRKQIKETLLSFANVKIEDIKKLSQIVGRICKNPRSRL